MKKKIGIIILLLTLSITVFAGSIPEDLLGNENAKLYIGMVDGRTTLDEATLPYEENKVLYIDITPTYKYKGDVEIGVSQTYTNPNFGSFIPEKGKEYLFGYIDENNFYIYEIKSRDENSIKLVDSDKYDMTKRLEDYINEGAFSRAEEERQNLGKQISLIEYLYEKPTFSSSAVEKVTLRYQDYLHEIGIDDFRKVAENIMITNVKNGILYEEGTPDAYKTNLYIELLDENNQLIYYCAVTRFGEVDRYSLFMSRLMGIDYEMKPEDLLKLYSLFPADVQKNIKAPEGLPTDTPLELPAIPKKNYAGYLTGGIILIFAIAFLVGFTLRRKNKK